MLPGFAVIELDLDQDTRLLRCALVSVDSSSQHRQKLWPKRITITIRVSAFTAWAQPQLDPHWQIP
jgi:hypothetical protein